MRRLAAAVLVLLGAWWAMQAVHELGHVIAAWSTGGVVHRVVLHPLSISRTDVSPNPNPLIVAWAGPAIGILLPSIAAAVFRGRPLACFFAGFCLIANGLYIALGSFAAVGDAGDLLRNGAPQIALLAFGVASTSLGLWIWHCLTKKYPLFKRNAIPS